MDEISTLDETEKGYFVRFDRLVIGQLFKSDIKSDLIWRKTTITEYHLFRYPGIPFDLFNNKRFKIDNYGIVYPLAIVIKEQI